MGLGCPYNNRCVGTSRARQATLVIARSLGTNTKAETAKGRETTSHADLMIASLLGCGDDKAIVDPGSQNLPQTSPENVLKNLQASYKNRE